MGANLPSHHCDHRLRQTAKCLSTVGAAPHFSDRPGVVCAHGAAMPTLRFPTIIGECSVDWSEQGLTAFRLPHNPDFTRAAPIPKPLAASGDPVLDTLATRIANHLRGVLQDFSDLPYDWSRVTPFQAKVLRAVLAIPAGTTATYGEIARTIGAKPGSSRAVGGAVGANPWPLLVPCHRVLGAGGKLTGYSGPGGMRTKTTLLGLEGVVLPSV